jgi:hypothetical protein
MTFVSAIAVVLASMDDTPEQRNRTLGACELAKTAILEVKKLLDPKVRANPAHTPPTQTRPRRESRSKPSTTGDAFEACPMPGNDIPGNL